MNNLVYVSASCEFIECFEAIKMYKKLLHKCVDSDFINLDSLATADIGIRF